MVDATGLGVHDHICWPYTDPSDFRARALEFLADGLRQGLKVCYVGPGAEARLWADLGSLPDRDHHGRRGALQVASLPDIYRSGGVVVPAEQMRAYAAATERALRQGFAGFRVVAETTSLVRTTEQVDAFAAYEHLVDRYMATHPFSALCACRSAELPRGPAEVACMHPLVRRGTVLFRLSGADRADAALGGEVDVTVHDLFAAALHRADLGGADARADARGAAGRTKGGRRSVVIDGEGLTHIDHRALVILSDHARRIGTTIVLRTSHPGPSRVIDVLGLDDITVEAAVTRHDPGTSGPDGAGVTTRMATS